MAQELWLKCKVTAGQFSDERAVFGVDFSGREFSLFVPDEFVEVAGEPTHQQTDGWVQVWLIDEKEDLVLVGLPRPALENGLTVTVRRGALKAWSAQQKA